MLNFNLLYQGFKCHSRTLGRDHLRLIEHLKWDAVVDSAEVWKATTPVAIEDVRGKSEIRLKTIIDCFRKVVGRQPRERRHSDYGRI